MSNWDPAGNKSKISRRRRAALEDGSSDYKAKRDELIHVAANLFREKGYKATTLNDIAKMAGLERATAYYYVGSKEVLLREAIQGALDTNISELHRILGEESLSSMQKLQSLIERLMISYEETYPYMYVYIQEQMHTIADEKTPWARKMVWQTREFENAFRALISEGIASGDLRDDLSVGLAENAIFGMLNWTHRWYKPGGKLTARQVAEGFCEIFFNGVRPRTKADAG